MVHLWVEGFFEVFATAVIALLFTAPRVRIYLENLIRGGARTAALLKLPTGSNHGPPGPGPKEG